MNSWQIFVYFLFAVQLDPDALEEDGEDKPKNRRFACQRITPLNHPNEKFTVSQTQSYVLNIWLFPDRLLLNIRLRRQISKNTFMYGTPGNFTP